MADTTITEDDVAFHEDLTYMGYLLDALEHGCIYHPRAQVGDRAAERTRLDYTINNLRIWWPEDKASRMLADWHPVTVIRP